MPTHLSATTLPALALAALTFTAWASVTGASEPVPLVFDTDICGDCDDVLALAMIHALQSRGECRLVAVTVSADHALAGPFVDAVNTFYGRPGVPIGVVGPGGPAFKSRYLALAEERDGGKPWYPHALTSGRSAPSATSVLRRALAGQPDGSLVVVQVGFATNLARLLDSPADDVSPMTGEALVRKKVKLLSLMAGAFRPIGGDARYREYNVVNDVPGARALAARWPSEMVWSGFEVGVALPYPAVSIERDYGYVAHHPVAEAYRRYDPPPHERPTWDLTSVLAAVRPGRDYFDLSPPGTVTVERDGFTRFEPAPGGRSRYLSIRPEQARRTLEALALLASQPPGGPGMAPPSP
jgi:purine nucleosidase